MVISKVADTGLCPKCHKYLLRPNEDGDKECFCGFIVYPNAQPPMEPRRAAPVNESKPRIINMQSDKAETRTCARPGCNKQFNVFKSSDRQYCSGECAKYRYTLRKAKPEAEHDGISERRINLGGGNYIQITARLNLFGITPDQRKDINALLDTIDTLDIKPSRQRTK